MPNWMRRTGMLTRIFGILLLFELLRSLYGYLNFPGRAFGLSYSFREQGLQYFGADRRVENLFRDRFIPGVGTQEQVVHHFRRHGFDCQDVTSKTSVDEAVRVFKVCKSKEHKPFAWFPIPEWRVYPLQDGTFTANCKCQLQWP